MTLLRELFFTQFVEHIEFLSQQIDLQVTDGSKLDLNNNFSIRNHHRHTSKEYLQVFRQFLTTSITGIHCNEVRDGRNEFNFNFFFREHELLHVLLSGSGNRFDLHSHDRQDFQIDTIEFIETTPKTTLDETLEDLSHITISMLI